MAIEASDAAADPPPLTPLAKAQRGDPTAIGHLISQQLQPHGIRVQVQQHRGVLKIGLRRAAPLSALN